MNARHDGLSTKVHAEKLLCLPHTDPGCCRIWGRRFQVIADASSCAIARVGTRIPNCSRAAASTTCLLHSLETVEFTNHFRPFLGDNFSREPRNFPDARCRFRYPTRRLWPTSPSRRQTRCRSSNLCHRAPSSGSRNRSSRPQPIAARHLVPPLLQGLESPYQTLVSRPLTSGRTALPARRAEEFVTTPVRINRDRTTP
jgi:hypothetical protein